MIIIKYENDEIKVEETDSKYPRSFSIYDSYGIIGIYEMNNGI